MPTHKKPSTERVNSIQHNHNRQTIMNRLKIATRSYKRGKNHDNTNPVSLIKSIFDTRSTLKIHNSKIIILRFWKTKDSNSHSCIKSQKSPTFIYLLSTVLLRFRYGDKRTSLPIALPKFTFFSQKLHPLLNTTVSQPITTCHFFATTLNHISLLNYQKPFA